MDYPANSRHQPTPAPKESKDIKPVVSGGVVRRKQPVGKRIKEHFIGEDSRGVFNYVLMDILIPAAKDAIADSTTAAVERKLFGHVRSSGRRGSRGGSPHGVINYSQISSNKGSNTSARREDPRQVSQRARANHDFDEIILATRGEAEEVLDRLFDLLSRYEVATVEDLYQLTGITGNYTDRKWGWTELRGAGVSRARGGYLLDLPRPEPID